MKRPSSWNWHWPGGIRSVKAEALTQTWVSMNFGVVEEHLDLERVALAQEERIADVVPLRAGPDVGEDPLPAKRVGKASERRGAARQRDDRDRRADADGSNSGAHAWMLRVGLNPPEVLRAVRNAPA